MSQQIRAFIYARKSTDAEDRQVFSIEHQIKELRELAVKHNLLVVAELEEHRTAKLPGRPVFNEMLRRVRRGEAGCIIAWHPDRLARNAPDGSAIAHLIDTSRLADLKFVTFWFEPTPQGMLMLSIAFGMSKYYVDAMSQGIKRAYRRRIAEGFWPRRPPIGYVFDRNSRSVQLDPVRAPLVRQTFQLYATGDYTLEALCHTMNSRGLRSRPSGKYRSVPLATSRFHHMLTHPFYAGMMRHKGELFEGRHERIVPIALFDECQVILAQRGRRSSRPPLQSRYCKMFRCGECGCTITSETKKGHVYLRCTKRTKSCSQRYLREETAARLIAAAIKRLIVPPEEIGRAIAELRAKQAAEAASVADDLVQLRARVASIDEKHRRLADLYVDGSLAAAEFHAKKEKLLRITRQLSENIAFLEKHPKERFEPVIRFIGGLTEPQKLIESNNYSKQRDFFKKVGSNLFIKNGRIMWEGRGPWKILVAQRRLGARASLTPASSVVPDEKNPTLCSAGSENRTVVVLDAVCEVFKDNPNWAWCP